MNKDLLNYGVRKELLRDIKSFENVQRKKRSIKSFEIYNDNSYQFVYEELVKQLSEKTANQMPIVSNLNVAKAVVNQEAEIYTDDPTRTYTDISDSDKKALEDLYTDSKFNTVLIKANKTYKRKNQAFLQVVPKEGRLILRSLQEHNIDVIPDENDPEKAYAYIISSFDKSEILNNSDRINQSSADADDYKALAERYQIWTAEYTFVMNGKGDYVVEPMINPIKMLPFIDVSSEKDYEFFVRLGDALTDFTVQFNVAWSDLMYISRMQGYSVGVLSGDANLKPDNMIIGPNRFLFLPKNADNPDSKLELDFKSPSPNIEASLKTIDSLIATFLSTRGVDSKTVSSNNSGQTTFSSALERLFAMIENFKASKEDFDLFSYVEYQLHKIVTAYLSAMTGTEFLNPKYNVSSAIVSSQVQVNFVKPEMLETKAEKLENGRKKIDLGIADKVDILSEVENIDANAAEQKLIDIETRKLEFMTKVMGADVQKSALNGAQVTSLVEIVTKVAANLIPRDSAKYMIVTAFNVSEEQAEDILSNAGNGFQIDTSQLGVLTR